MATDATGTPTTNYSLPKYNTAVDPPSGKGTNAMMDAVDTAIKTVENKAVDIGLLIALGG
ncbi:MAG TPA: hypothetical protein VIY48_02090 [Candidatus Paceibacterota bacterium]